MYFQQLQLTSIYFQQLTSSNIQKKFFKSNLPLLTVFFYVRKGNKYTLSPKQCACFVLQVWADQITFNHELKIERKLAVAYPSPFKMCASKDYANRTLNKHYNFISNNCCLATQ